MNVCKQAVDPFATQGGLLSYGSVVYCMTIGWAKYK